MKKRRLIAQINLLSIDNSGLRAERNALQMELAYWKDREAWLWSLIDNLTTANDRLKEQIDPPPPECGEDRHYLPHRGCEYATLVPEGGIEQYQAEDR